MAYLNKEQYEYRREAAATRNVKNEQTAIENGMTENQADLISRLCSLRHEYHCNLAAYTKDSESREDIRRNFARIEEEISKEGLPELDIANTFDEVDDMDGLIYYYGDDVPEDHDSAEFQEWYKEEYSRIYDELSDVNDTIEKYLKKIDDKYKTSFCPTGALRAF
ncbi:hypothetical protein [Leyella stercorea]|uniref:hypothetical protein n=1 Tax=Leyella stercorea TaxID=363265 RepID=UPI002432AFBB|nr:hypothetical protein [Leyella stercorea]